MTENLWDTTDFPVLKAAVEICNEGRGAAAVGAIIKRTGFDQQTVMASLRRLDTEQPPFFTKMEKMFGGGVSHVFEPTGHAQRAIQAWPKAEDKLEELIKVLVPSRSRRTTPRRRAALPGSGTTWPPVVGTWPSTSSPV
ncbi:hypothetical protein U2F26_23920 [Micromonospora sp. 4G57]|uniref:Uncharacterized protein n=1 Tax=Micromonospora sicca TaxID=2202420 RepID=A0ABU5JGQ5_9ACTN|nr:MULTISPECIES: hypothetical protein [unclassified Micromonospora]MDZ5445741.1 hypothetical protein [Micromonospora sp. 4G57]MDZ5491657.1 hypothetical protein [Micromonospora sp. 4G53]